MRRIHQIGEWRVINLLHRGRGPPELARREILPVQRPGVDNAELIDLGYPSREFELLSLEDLEKYEDAPDRVKLYLEQVGQLLDIAWNGINYTEQYQTRFKLVDVQPVIHKRIGVSSGGINDNPEAILKCLWRFITFKIPDEPVAP